MLSWSADVCLFKSLSSLRFRQALESKVSKSADVAMNVEDNDSPSISHSMKLQVTVPNSLVTLRWNFSRNDRTCRVDDCRKWRCYRDFELRDYCKAHVDLARCLVGSCKQWSLDRGWSDRNDHCVNHQSSRFDKDGFDRYGFDKDCFDKDGFDKSHFDKDGFDKDGFGKDGFNQDRFNQSGAHRIHDAAKSGHLREVQTELANGVPVDLPTENYDWDAGGDDCPKLTPLMFAAAQGYLKIVKLLVYHKASVDKTDSNGQTALHHTCVDASGHVSIAQFLLASGADINKTDKYGFTPLMWTAYHCRADKQFEQIPDADRNNRRELRDREGMRPSNVVKLLLEREAAVEADVTIKSTADVEYDVSMQRSKWSWNTGFGKDVEHVSYVERHGVINKGSTALQIAEQMWRSRTDGSTVLLADEQMRQSKTVRLLQFAVDVNTTAWSDLGWTRLMRAAYDANDVDVERLIERKADITIKSTADKREGPKKGSTAMDIAKEAKHAYIVALLQAAAAFDKNIFNKDGFNQIHLAARNGDLKAVRVQVDQGVSVDVVSKCAAGLAPLMMAAKYGHLDVVTVLVSCR